MRDSLQIAGGVREVVDGKRLIDWAASGSKWEDNFPRFLNHFHNPLQEFWEHAGPGFGQSSVLWSQNPEPLQGWSWPQTRDYYYKSLTERTKADREKFLAKTFRGLGHVIHLIQDAGVPAHTRSDPHFFYSYETLVRDVQLSDVTAEQRLFEKYLSSPAPELDPRWRSLAPNPLAPVPIARLIDTDRYVGTDEFTGTNPDITTSSLIGIAEYTNVNFLSEDSIWGTYASDRLRPFRYPARSSVREERFQIDLPSGEKVWRWYYEKIADGDSGYRLATIGFLRDYFVRYHLDPGRADRKPALDETVYKDYAARLLPRAVGYSVAALNYFFRGRLAAQVEAVLDPVLGPRDALRLVNRTPTDAMAGAVELLYDAVDGSRVSLDRWPVTLETNALSDPFPIPPPLPDKPPLEPGRYLLVFRGRLGDEPDAVAAQWVSTSVWRLELSVETWDKDGTLYGLARLAPGPTTAEARWRLTPAALFDGAAGYGYVTDVRAWYFKTLEYVYRCGGRDCTPFIEDTLHGDSAYSVLLYRSSPDLLGETAALSVSGFCANLAIASQYAGQQYDVTYTPVTVEVVRFADPPSLAALQGYTFLTLPAVDSVLATVTVPDLFRPVEVPVDLMGALLLGVRLTTLPAGYPPVITPSGIGGFLDNVCFHGILLKYGACLSLANFYEVPNLCAATVELRFGPSRPPPAPEPGPPIEPEPPALPD
ncbi:MAG: hypothetical protein HY002_08100 [Candidatus Rokubacteria bacterium]|nr:hypothetical protein [Candidatus Rokubacteria bacterium]